MQYEFLKQFPRRMKNVGLYCVLISNSIQKGTWQKYGFKKLDEQINLLFAVLLYIMEQSLREEICTMDDIGAFIDNLNIQYLGKPMSYEDSKLLGDFIVNVILSNEGRAMYFDGFEFEQNAYKIMNISYVANRVVYVDSEVRRTSYYLTDDGYNLLLGTLEIENNMKLTIHEMIFKMHLEKQSYDKAVDEIKNVFNLLRIQLQKIQEAMGRIRRNALSYSVSDYQEILTENLETIADTKKKFQSYREMVAARAAELENENINVRHLTPREEETLQNLKTIESYLTRTIDEHQKILNHHFDLKALYTKELEQMSQMSLIKRFSFRTEVYEKLLSDARGLTRTDYFLRPLFNQEPAKIYNLNKALEVWQPARVRKGEENEELLDFDGEEWEREQERKLAERLRSYEESLGFLVTRAVREGEISLLSLQNAMTEQERGLFIPNVEIFKEIMVELIKTREISIEALKKERSEFLSERADSFQLNEMLLDLTEKRQELKTLKGVEIYRIEDGNTVVFDGVRDEYGREKCIRCSNVLIRALTEA